MLETAAARWASAGNLRPLLEGMPKLVHLLGFEFYLFTSPTSQLHSNLGPEELACLDAFASSNPIPGYVETHELPLLWTVDAFLTAPDLWAVLQASGLRHGWVQPSHLEGTHSSLTVLRPRWVISPQELYRKAGFVMWAAQQLHRASLIHHQGSEVSDTCGR